MAAKSPTAATAKTGSSSKKKFTSTKTFKWSMIGLGTAVVVACVVAGVVVGTRSSSSVSSSFSSIVTTSGGSFGCDVGETLVVGSANGKSGTFCCPSGENPFEDDSECVLVAKSTTITSTTGSSTTTIVSNHHSISENVLDSDAFNTDFNDVWKNWGNFPNIDVWNENEADDTGLLTVDTDCQATESVNCSGDCASCVNQINRNPEAVDVICKEMVKIMNSCSSMNGIGCSMIFFNSDDTRAPFGHINTAGCIQNFI